MTISIDFSFGVCCVAIIGKGSVKRDQNMHGKAHSFLTSLNEGSNLIMVNYNNTYLQNPDYPSGSVDMSSITYEVNKIHDGKIFFSLCVAEEK